MRKFYSPIVGCTLSILHAEEQIAELPEVDLKQAKISLDKVLELYDKLLENQEEEIAKYNNELAIAVGTCTAAKNTLYTSERRLEKFSKLKAGECPTCLQDASEEHLGRCREELKKQILEEEQTVDLAQVDLSEAKVSLEQVKDNHLKQKEKAEEIKNQAKEK
jgi:hypothetical protein